MDVLQSEKRTDEHTVGTYVHVLGRTEFCLCRTHFCHMENITPTSQNIRINGVNISIINVNVWLKPLSLKSSPDVFMEVVLGPPASVSEAELLFTVLGGLSGTQREQVYHISAVYIPPSESDNVGPSFMSRQYKADSNTAIFDYQMKFGAAVPGTDMLGIDPLTQDNCPGCGNTLLEEKTNPFCAHPFGCGYFRELNQRKSP